MESGDEEYFSGDEILAALAKSCKNTSEIRDSVIHAAFNQNTVVKYESLIQSTLPTEHIVGDTVYIQSDKEKEYLSNYQRSSTEPGPSSEKINNNESVSNKSTIKNMTYNLNNNLDRKSLNRNINQNARMLGEKYVGYRRPRNSNKIFHDIEREERKMGAKCMSKLCTRSKLRNCHKFTDSIRNEIFEAFWKQKTWDEKKLFVSNMTEQVAPKTRSNKSGHSCRTETIKYFLKIDNDKLQVCKLLFLSTLGIKDWTARHWLGNDKFGMVQKNELTEIQQNCSKVKNCEIETISDRKNWSRNKSKNARMLGDKYVEYRNPKTSIKVFHDIEREERKMGAKCISKLCARSKLRNCNKFNDSIRNYIFEAFWKQMMWDERKTFVLNMTEQITPKRRRSNCENSCRTETIKYFLKIDNDRFQICKSLFLSTLGIKESTVRHWLGNEKIGIIRQNELPEIQQSIVETNICELRNINDRKNWSRSKNKMARMLGEKYVGYRRPGNSNKIFHDIERGERKMGPNCTSNLCARSKLRNCNKFTDSIRKDIFETFWKKMIWDQRKIFVSNMTEQMAPKRRRSKIENTFRTETIKYFLKIDNDRLQICKSLFLSTLGIKDWTVRNWLGTVDKFVMIKKNGLSIKQKRCFENNANLKFLHEFLDSLATLPSDYCKHKFSQLYIEPPISSLAQIYQIYKDKCTEEKFITLGRNIFKKIMNQNNLSIFKPKIDQCFICLGYKIKRISEEIWKIHIQKKNRAKQEKEQDKENAKKCLCTVLTMGLQDVKVCPKILPNLSYNKTKLSCHNFTIYNLSTRDVICYWFSEVEAKFSASTFTAFIIDYLDKIVLTFPTPFIIYSDGEIYHYKNIVMANALLQFSLKYKVQVIQKFLENGHNQMEINSVHNLIENQINEREIYIPSQYVNICREARMIPFPFISIEIDHTFFKNYSSTIDYVYSSIGIKSNGDDTSITEIQELVYEPDGLIKFRLNFDDDLLDIPQCKNFKNVSRIIEYSKLYNKQLEITATKYKHLQEFKSSIPTDFHNFYDALPFSGSLNN